MLSITSLKLIDLYHLNHLPFKNDDQVQEIVNAIIEVRTTPIIKKHLLI